MKTLKLALVLLALSTAGFPAWAEELTDFRATMEENNTAWLQAYNDQNAQELGKMYAEDAIVIAAGGQPIRGANAIEDYWTEDVQGYRDHTWEILETRGEGDLAYQVAEWTVSDRSSGQKYSGNTIRILEPQPDGKWLTKVHMFSVHE